MIKTRLFTLSLVLALFAGVAGAQSTPTFNVSLGSGSTQKEEVLKLQNFLHSLGYLKVQPTGIYLSLTAKAVADFQSAQGITPASGYFGPLTRAVANKILAGGTPSAAPSAPKSEIKIESITDELGTAAAVLSKGKTVKWKTTNYPTGAGVNINLLRKVSDSPLSFSLVRVISTSTADDGTETWIPQTGENTNDLFIEITCSSTFKFASGCQFSTGPVKINQ